MNKGRGICYAFLAMFYVGAGVLALFLVSKSSDQSPLKFAFDSAEANATFDSYGIPTITATSIPSFAYAAGYIHARDRLWVMHFLRLFAAGRMSEVPYNSYHRSSAPKWSNLTR